MSSPSPTQPRPSRLKPGRPALHPSMKRRNVVALKLTDAEYADLLGVAAFAPGTTPADLGRRLLVGVVRSLLNLDDTDSGILPAPISSTPKRSIRMDFEAMKRAADAKKKASSE